MGSPWSTENSPVGRILVAPSLPAGTALFYTSGDFDGRLTLSSVARLTLFVRERFGIEAALSSCGQVHGTRVQRVGHDGDRWCEYPGCDALFSSESNVALGIKVADCLPVTVVDREHSVVANIHAGWRGAAADIVSRTLTEMRLQTRFEPAAASAWLGPSIRACCFEVGNEVVAEFRSRYPNFDTFVDRSRGEKPFVDLPALERDVLQASGVAAERIFDSGVCTRCGTEFHSYRRDRGLSGRNLAIVAQ
jgi:polyphenol oxidase